uniref:uncharacterized protein LOC129509363 n=1 Tax=Nyctereutes procyonoides TaxID=34880 RepID=UPI0024437D60|nr:uncharacterized protein LOC129509363 [Nyctereutes procyonoides]
MIKLSKVHFACLTESSLVLSESELLLSILDLLSVFFFPSSSLFPPPFLIASPTPLPFPAFLLLLSPSFHSSYSSSSLFLQPCPTWPSLAPLSPSAETYVRSFSSLSAAAPQTKAPSFLEVRLNLPTREDFRSGHGVRPIWGRTALFQSSLQPDCNSDQYRLLRVDASGEQQSRLHQGRRRGAGSWHCTPHRLIHRTVHQGEQKWEHLSIAHRLLPLVGQG